MIARGVPGRSGKSCRLRWCNQLDPCVKRKPFTGFDQDNFILPVSSLGIKGSVSKREKRNRRSICHEQEQKKTLIVILDVKRET
ncbi:hypothetical protein PIB30_015744 [Stylosanthes scabra]|uniref:HTH myb-type domain-containing protein n=1 Tax=Stylosanthes scabra TaxID=79078 RepID=A0ABU6X6W5_9FABA|nr:hypothetical protein [Stylosanthes scabra]